METPEFPFFFPAIGWPCGCRFSMEKMKIGGSKKQKTQVLFPLLFSRKKIVNNVIYIPGDTSWDQKQLNRNEEIRKK